MTLDKLQQLYDVSNPEKAQYNAFKYLDSNAVLYLSPQKNKKYRIYDPNKNVWIDFGDIRYQDFTLHDNMERRNSYLKRATSIQGNWQDNKYSPNNLSIHILWS